jgi:hypothetical protein
MKRPVGRPRKYRNRAERLHARKLWARAWRMANRERWREIQRKADAKRRGHGKLEPVKR